MKLYVCYGTFSSPRPGGHPCGNAYKALKEAGHEPELIKSYGMGLLPDIFNQTKGRKKARELTGSGWMPVLVTDEGEAIGNSHKIIAWAKANPKGAAAPAAPATPA